MRATKFHPSASRDRHAKSERKPRSDPLQDFFGRTTWRDAKIACSATTALLHAVPVQPMSPTIVVRPARPIWPAYVAESCSSVGTTLLMVGIFFFMKERFGWGLRENFLLAATQGVAYVGGSLAANTVAGRFGRRRGLIAVFILISLIPILPLMVREPGWVVVGLLAYTFVSALVWPALESLVASDADAHLISRRVGLYNLVWSGTNAVVFALSGLIIASWPSGMFVLPILVHAISAALFWWVPRIDPSPASEGFIKGIINTQEIHN